ncbi:MAG: Sugar-phosphate isomerase, RpiB/LacA/LacB family [Candidatus Roizmanbacteria bacterium GW2011_GWC2_41_7]|uniref:Sugar-phosphate isomerase, RpiB/LacA/LacB family n=1 Tax=Candidatus Roizmanbacteria bacterium GW2011_GWC2_41_7 TaxID=1618487 RepID=A0A0G0ZAS7_9BACT|nr:MAG: Sugar-phosphate isomerase, RpiB/LacA/LacB family [Candidatus Roizmanbacteria bacterium GW2011_GWC2_41_7]
MIYIGADKYGYKAISIVEEYFQSKSIEYTNVGVKSEKEDIQLESLIPKVVNPVKENNMNKGILSCGTGAGVEIGANRFSGIRACLAANEKIAEWSVVYDNSNILCLSGWEINKDNIKKILDAWLNAAYDGNQDRLKMMEEFDSWH